MAVKIYSCLNQGIEGLLIEVEVDILQGLSAFSIVGLGDTAVQESKERIRSAIKNSGAKYPQQKKIINLAPAHIKKHGPHFDLPMAVGLLAASGQVDSSKFKNAIIAGELALDGAVRPIKGVLTMALFAQKNGYSKIIIPQDNAAEASLVKNIEIIPIQNLKEVIIPGTHETKRSAPRVKVCNSKHKSKAQNLQDQITQEQITFDDIYGNDLAKRALEIAAAGSHHTVFTGPPGVGKTVLAKAFKNILPPLSQSEMLEVMQIYSNSGLLHSGIQIKERPFRQVHSSCSQIALTGGGTALKPGEVSLAHRGVLFLDELPEFPRSHLESLRQPLEEKEIHLARSSGSIKYPAQFTLIAGMNPCPCGYHNDQQKECKCRPYQVMQYQKKLSGPLIDRIDIVVEVERQDVKNYQKNPAETKQKNKAIKEKVKKARQIQTTRFKSLPIKTNSEMNAKQIKQFCPLTQECENILSDAGEQLALSGRQYFQIIKTARTIADLANCKQIQPEHLAEALQYRPTQ